MLPLCLQYRVNLCFCMCIVQCELFIIGLYSRLESRSSFYDKLDGHIVYSQ